jgi:hypothetical protein
MLALFPKTSTLRTINFMPRHLDEIVLLEKERFCKILRRGVFAVFDNDPCRLSLSNFTEISINLAPFSSLFFTA